MSGRDRNRIRHVLGIGDLSRPEVDHILSTARVFKEILSRSVKKVPTLRGRLAVNLFFEPSTRTRTSFEVAGKMLSADVINFSASASSLGKGETLLDTAKNLEAMHPDVVVVRSQAAGVPWMLAHHLGCAVINAGDGLHEHPSQALLDALTLLDHFETLRGKRVVIVGDIAHSRVAGSNLRLLPMLGARVRVVGPPTMIPVGMKAFPQVEVCYDLDAGLEGADAVMMLRIQKERIAQPLFPSNREYSRRFGLSLERAARLAPGTLILHPGPINRGVEIDPRVADGPGSVILDQVENGVAVRMALLYLTAGHGDSKEQD